MKLKRTVWPLSLFAFPMLLLVPALSPASDQAAYWSYEGEEGPEHWSDLQPRNSRLIFD